MGFESVPKPKTVEQLSQEAFELARKYRTAAEGRGAEGSKEFNEFQNARSRLEHAIQGLERSGVARENLESLYEELKYPKSQKGI